MNSRLLAGVAVVVMAVWPAAAAEPGDAAAGHKLASKLCTACHIVGSERVGSDAAPPFPVIAQDPARKLTELHSWHGPMHPVLSNLALSTKQIADINAYLDSLRAPSEATGTPTPTAKPPPSIQNAPPAKIGPPIETKPK